jgi:CRP-like cAMP-binding protein
MEMQRVPQWTAVVSQGARDDAMYFILEGELRVRIVQAGKETILSTLGPGDFFGEISLFDRGPRSADVVANSESTVLKMTAATFEKIAKEAPDVATPFLQGTIRTLAARIRADDKRIGDSAKLNSAAGF